MATASEVSPEQTFMRLQSLASLRQCSVLSYNGSLALVSADVSVSCVLASTGDVCSSYLAAVYLQTCADASMSMPALDLCRFLTDPDPNDPVVKSHYRMIRSFTADDPRPLVQGKMSSSSGPFLCGCRKHNTTAA